MIDGTMILKKFLRKSKTALIGGAVMFATLLTPLASFAASENGEREIYDARLEVYPKNVTLDGGGTALMYFLLLVLAGLCVGVLFKNANRSHLD
jgi:hypothetical protein